MTPDSLKRRVLEAARDRPSPPRAAAPSRPLLTSSIIALAASAMCAVLALAGGPAAVDARPLSTSAALLAGTALLAVLASGLVLPPARSMLPRPRGRLLAAVVGAPLLLGLWLVLWHGTYPEPSQRFGWRCLGLTLASAPWPFAALLFLRRRFDPVQPGYSGAALGAAAGAWAAILVELWCPLSSSGHVAFGHVLPLALLAGSGAVAGRRLLGARRSAAV